MKSVALAAAAMATAVTIGLALGWTINGWRLSGRIQSVKTEQAEYRAAVKEAGEKALADARATEKAWQSQIEKVRIDAKSKLDEVERNAADADATALSLRDQLSHLSTRIAGSPGAPTGSSATFATCGMLTELLAESDRLAGIYAATADGSRVAGEACEVAYSAVAN